jgi:hypothetical protein
MCLCSGSTYIYSPLYALEVDRSVWLLIAVVIFMAALCVNHYVVADRMFHHQSDTRLQDKVAFWTFKQRTYYACHDENCSRREKLYDHVPPV